MDGEYPEFRNDALNSLALCMMASESWIEGEGMNARPLVSTFLRWEENDGSLAPSGWDAGETNGALSSLMFFCLKYLDVSEIPSWIGSLVAPDDPYWKGALMVWLLGSYDLLRTPVALPSKLEKANPRVGWQNSHSLGGRDDADHSEGFNENRLFLVSANNTVFLSEVCRQLTPDLILRWTDELASDEVLAAKLLNTSELLFDKLTAKEQ